MVSKADARVSEAKRPVLPRNDETEGIGLSVSETKRHEHRERAR
jgi:hypothetical protein